MGYDPRAREEMVFAEIGIIFSTKGYPMTAGDLNTSFSIYQGDLFWDGGSSNKNGYVWDDFLKHCLIQLKSTSYSDGTEVYRSTPQRFETITDFLEFINDNVDNDGSTFLHDTQIKVFNQIDHSATSINRLNSQNTFYAVLNATSKLTHNSSLIEIPNFDRWGEDNYKQFIINAWLHVWGIVVTSAEYDADPMSWRGSVWVQTRKTRNLYNLPTLGKNIEIQVGSVDSGRRQVLEGLPHVVTMPQDYEKFRFEKKAVATMAQSGLGVTWGESAFEVTGGVSPLSALMVFGIQRGDKKAIYVKPLGGIDAICVPKFDTKKYRLEAMYTSSQHKDRFRIVPVTMECNLTYSGWITRDKFWLGSKAQGVYHWSVSKDIGKNIRFYLRRLDTNLVTPMSKVYIKAVRNREKSAGSGLDFLIETDKI